MDTSARRIAQGLRILFAVGLVLGSLGGTSHAREGWFVQAGLGGSDVGSHDLDGKTTITDSQNDQLKLGKLSHGVAQELIGGYGFNRFLGVEIGLLSAAYDADFTGVGADRAGIVGISWGARLSAPLGKAGEVYARGGEGSYGLVYPNSFGKDGTTGNSHTALLSGRATHVGGGFEFWWKQAGFGLSVTTYDMSFDALSVASNSHPLASRIHAPVTNVMGTFSFHLK